MSGKGKRRRKPLHVPPPELRRALELPPKWRRKERNKSFARETAAEIAASWDRMTKASRLRKRHHATGSE